MQLCELTKEQFDEFSYGNKYSTFYQTSNYGNFMMNFGYEVSYIGLVDDSNVVAATLLLHSKLVFDYKYAYAPRGFLIDYNNLYLFQIFTDYLIKYLKSKKYVFIKLNLPFLNKQGYNSEQLLSNSVNNIELLEKMKKLGYNYLVFNNEFQALISRWEVIIDLNSDIETFFNSLKSTLRRKIKSMYRKGINIYKGTENDIETFYNVIKHNPYSESLQYYKKIHQFFGDNFEMYFAKMDFSEYIESYKKLYEIELLKNNILIQKLRLSKSKNKSIYNKKIASDKCLIAYKNHIIKSTKLYRDHNEGIIVGALAIIKYKDEIRLIIDGYNLDYKKIYNNYCLKWEVIKKYIGTEYTKFNLGILVGRSKNSNKYFGFNKSKLYFNSKILEYIGEIDLIIDKTKYRLFYNYTYLKTKLSKIKNIINIIF